MKVKYWFRPFYRHHHDLINRYGMSVPQMTTDMIRLSWLHNNSALLSSCVTHNQIFNESNTKVSLVEQDLLTLPVHLCSVPILSVLLSLLLSVYCFVHHCLSFFPFSLCHCIVYPSIGHCIVCPSSIGHCIVCPSSIGHCIVCPSSIGHCIVCPSSIGHCIVCPSSRVSVLWGLTSQLVVMG